MPQLKEKDLEGMRENRDLEVVMEDRGLEVVMEDRDLGVVMEDRDLEVVMEDRDLEVEKVEGDLEDLDLMLFPSGHRQTMRVRMPSHAVTETLRTGTLLALVTTSTILSGDLPTSE